MKSLKKVACTACALFMAFSVAAQEKSAEQEYLSTVEDVVITELANSDERDNKLVALQYLENAVEEGRVSPDMLVALDRLAGEGVNTQSRQSGRLMNNYPDIRAKACDLLGKVPSEESKTTLKKIALEDNEPMVITAAVRSLGEIGMNNNDDVITTIAWANKKNAVLNPTSSLALEVLIAYEKIADKVQDKSAMIQSVGQIATNYHYVKPVRERALELLKKLQSGNTGSSKKDAK
ncbi:MAG: HEAT repeat domain-containing protein [Treponema sp.]|uniref:HEAT repeat domain-containing protein n=1 Tax=Treponema sp. TaxID=166 RepID=UPI0025D50691|nr:HEAT repeat domain-containing protein [Treponema sp.]MBQ9624317.1 HEAT repeat domain-containing protein [Treponema sp.]MBR0497265.1 HEAT repeat domain-containing protein [Treponema sp.]